MRTTASGTPAHTPNSPRFTPGPWHEHSHRQIGPDAGIVCEVWAAIGWGDEAIQQAEANVRLIVALAAIIDESVALKSEGDGFHILRSQFIEQAREALQIAQEGRQ